MFLHFTSGLIVLNFEKENYEVGLILKKFFF